MNSHSKRLLESHKARRRLACRRRLLRIIDTFGWLAVAGVLATYLLGTPKQFDVANVALCLPVAAPALVRRAWPSAVISLAFGVFGALHLLGVSA